MAAEHRSSDTTPEGHDAQNQAYRLMGGERRLAIAFRLTELARMATTAGVRARHPEYSDRQVHLAFARIRLGDELTKAVWPEEPLVEP